MTQLLSRSLFQLSIFLFGTFSSVSVAMEKSQAGPALAKSPEPEERDQEPDWARVIRGFRRDHNFAATIGYAQNRWDGQSQKVIDRFEAQTEAMELKLSYAFHLPLVWGVGYVLGTHAGLITEEKNARGFALARTYILPGIDLGLVWNLNESFRLLGVYSYGWQRPENMTLDMNPREGPDRLAATGDTRAFRLVLDYFFEISMALRIEGENSRFSYSAKDRFELVKSGRVIRLGLVKHLL